MSTKKRTTYMEYSKRGVRIEWEYIGEGWEGDYNPEDPNDEPMLRFTVLRLVDGDWEQVDDSSYCTMVNVYTSKKILKEYLELIYRHVAEDVVIGKSIKKACEWLSWLGSGTPEIPGSVFDNP